MNTALYIGRFQPFHLGHLSVVRAALKENDFLVIGVGSAETSNEDRNPLNFTQRWQLITAALDEAQIPHASYTIIPIRDIHDDERWVEHVRQLTPPFNKIYSGTPHVQTLFQKDGKHQVITPIFKHDMCATDIRAKIKTKEAWEQLVPPVTIPLIKSFYE